MVRQPHKNPRMSPRTQRTIERIAQTRGIGFLTGQTITVRFMPAKENTGIVFQRLDLEGQPLIPATMPYVASGNRHTLLQHRGATVALTEHVMAALAGMQIDNCIVQIDGPEAPGCDGSALDFVRCLQTAGIVTQAQSVNPYRITEKITLVDAKRNASIIAFPTHGDQLILEYQLDYGRQSPIPEQSAQFVITPYTFVSEVAFCRTFILEQEIEMLKARGYGKNTNTSHLLVFGESGLIENTLRVENECARHKLLDCIGDFALLGRPIIGHIIARKTGHEHNHQFLHEILSLQERRYSRAA